MIRSLILVLLIYCAMTNSLPINTAVGKPSVDADWDLVLELSATKRVNAKLELQKIASRSSSKPSTNLARLIIRRWDDVENTFYLERPMPLDAKPFENFQEKLRPGFSYFEVSVNERGLPTEVYMKWLPLDSELRKLATDIALGSLYCPSKPKDRYTKGRAAFGAIKH
jgi:hypothetical protein